MNRLLAMFGLWAFASGVVPPVFAADVPQKETSAAEKTAFTVEQLTERAKPAVVVVTVEDRNGRPLGLGSGFVISSDGLIATNLHVIMEARPISVQFSNGKKFDVIAVHATEKSMDLAILRINAKDLPHLELGDAKQLKQGQPVVALGNPLGLKHSVVSGVVSEIREIDKRPMIQVAMPIEKGNSGGPLLDLFGRVQGLITLKSLVEDRVGFAVTVNALRPLIEKPNPIPMSQWQTIGVLDSKQWTSTGGARWKQRAGRISVEEPGQGFGGRSLCLAKQAVPEVPFEVAVSVKFTPTEGAAGLVFHADGGDKHYGFYPSAGKLRLTRFGGPDVYSWKVLEDKPHPAYHPTEWNQLKVRVEADRLLCFVNGQLVIESTDDDFKSGSVGLAKFRDTKAEFKQFQVAKEISGPSRETIKQITAISAAVTAEQSGSRELASKIATIEQDSIAVLRAEAQQLEQRAIRLKELASQVHARRVQQQIGKLVAADAKQFDLLRAALLLSQLDNDELEIDGYIATVERMAEEIKATVKADASEADRLEALHDYLFNKQGFHGSRTVYYHRSNSYLNEVLDDREGLPITLAVLHLELSKRLGLKVVGVPLPGHFVVRFEPSKGESKLVDVFESGVELSQEEARSIVRRSLRVPAEDTDNPALKKAIDDAFAPADSRTIIMRMLSNLMSVADEEGDLNAVGRYLDTMLVVDAESIETRAKRIDFSVRRAQWNDAITDIDWMLEKRPEGLNVEAVQRMRQQLAAELKK